MVRHLNSAPVKSKIELLLGSYVAISVIYYPTPAASPTHGVQAQCAPQGGPLAEGTHSYAAATKPDYHWDNLQTHNSRM